MNLQQLQSAMSGKSVTNGWDAVCAMNAAQLNTLFFQQWARSGPASVVRAMRIPYYFKPDPPLPGVGLSGVVELTVGPMMIQFQDGAIQVSIPVLSGRIIKASADFVYYAMEIPTVASSITGAASVLQTKGEIESHLGAIVAAFDGGTAYALQTPVPPTAMAADLAYSLGLYFSSAPLSYPIGTLATSSSGGIQPTAFQFALQSGPEAGDGAVLMLIKTSGVKGTPGPLSVYPIPDGSTAALLLTQRTIMHDGMASALPQGLEGTAGPNGLTFDVTGGSFDFGTLHYQHFVVILSCDSSGNAQDITLPGQGAVLSFDSSNNLRLQWSASWNQYFSISQSPLTEAACTISWDNAYVASMDPDNDVNVTFAIATPDGVPDVEPTVTVTPPNQKLHDVLAEWTGFDLETLEFPDLSTFALTNLLFPGESVIGFDDVSMPQDMLLTGALSPAVTVSPAQVTLAPGAKQSFTSSVPGVVWQVSLPTASIDSQGNFTAPPTYDPLNRVCIITATDGGNENSYGVAVVTILPTDTGIAFYPPMGWASQPLMVWVLDSSMTPVDVTITVAPAGAAQVEAGTSPGAWMIYELTQSVTLTATTAGGKTATMPVFAVTVDTIAVTASPGTGSQTNLVASSSNPNTTLSWMVSGPGTVALSNPRDTTRAVYTPPTPSGQAGTAVVSAYHLSTPSDTTQSAAWGMGSVQITL